MPYLVGAGSGTAWSAAIHISRSFFTANRTHRLTDIDYIVSLAGQRRTVRACRWPYGNHFGPIASGEEDILRCRKAIITLRCSDTCSRLGGRAGISWVKGAGDDVDTRLATSVRRSIVQRGGGAACIVLVMGYWESVG